MKSENPQGNPPNDLCAAEAESVFHELKKKELLLPFINDHGEACYLLNECKEDEWKTEIKDAIKPWYKKSRFISKFWNNTKFIFIAFIAGLAGSYAKVIVDQITGSSIHQTNHQEDQKIQPPK
jgi:hypothetical protein